MSLDENDAHRKGLRPDDPFDDSDEVRDPSGFDPSRPPLVTIPGHALIYVRTPDGGYVASDARMVYAESDRQNTGIEYITITERGQKRMDVPDLLRTYGGRADTLIYDLRNARSEYMPDGKGGGRLVLPCAQRVPLDPAFDSQVDHWLRLLGGTRADRLLDWLATAPDLTRTTAALYLKGSASAGKGLFAAGLAKLWGASVAAFEDVLGSAFNSALLNCPIVFLDESNTADVDHAEFRRLVGDSERKLTKKHAPTGTLLGCVRLVIAANNWNALRIRRADTVEDDEAIGTRILAIDIPDEAGEYLEGLGGDSFTRAHWTAGRMALPRHIAWLERERAPAVKLGTRFMVAGDGLWSEQQADLEAEAQAAVAADPWVPVVRARLDAAGSGPVPGTWLLEHVAGADVVKSWNERKRQHQAKRLARIARHLGWKRERMRLGGGERGYCYVPVNEPQPARGVYVD